MFILLYILLRLLIVIIICKICVNFRQEIHESVLQKMRQLNLLWNIFNRESTIRLLTSSCLQSFTMVNFSFFLKLFIQNLFCCYSDFFVYSVFVVFYSEFFYSIKKILIFQKNLSNLLDLFFVLLHFLVGLWWVVIKYFILQ